MQYNKSSRRNKTNFIGFNVPICHRNWANDDFSGLKGVEVDDLIFLAHHFSADSGAVPPCYNIISSMKCGGYEENITRIFLQDGRSKSL
ncbi:hypothetical protein EYC80_007545 [Monilinia laxa]|uniref:Uncharacterized protein n=1 Tax=Monilinia laxa TaxID=61186 RepID=A0A5N6JWA6_MONLA|nr:hypothetical protein EYC80_007545 [Monilinia laxa]